MGRAGTDEKPRWRERLAMTFLRPHDDDETLVHLALVGALQGHPPRPPAH